MDRELAKNLLWRMIRVRAVEEAIADEYAKQEMRCPVHLYIGQEAIAAGMSAAMQDADYMISTHRSHGHYLAKNGALAPMIAELYGKADGSSAGKGGSMHLFDPAVGYLGSSAIVGGNIPLVAGLALASQYRSEGRVAVAYFGDGATEEGVLYETLNFAALKKLPLIFVCENNHMSVLARLEERQAAPLFCERARAFGVEAENVDGNDAGAMYSVAKRAVDKARAGEGPSFIEAKTYRWRTHCGPQWDPISAARPEAEHAAWLARCPIALFEAMALAAGFLSVEEIAEIRAEILGEIDEAFVLAKASALPLPGELAKGIYV